MPARNIALIVAGVLMMASGMWWDAAYDYPIELSGDVAAALGGVVVALGFVLRPRR